jgi:hypothetical protein
MIRPKESECGYRGGNIGTTGFISSQNAPGAFECASEHQIRRKEQTGAGPGRILDLQPPEFFAAEPLSPHRVTTRD